MKLAILGDCHFGMRNDSLHFHNYYEKFYTECFFPYLKEHKINAIIQTGDVFDRRKFINYKSLELARNYFFDKLQPNNLELWIYIGNHDIYHKNTLRVNSPELLLQEYIQKRVVNVISYPTHICWDDPVNPDNIIRFDIIPWICQDNEDIVKNFIATTTNKTCFGHFEIAGFSMDVGSVNYEGMNRDDLGMYDTVISGHFHHKSSDGHIYYVGSPGEMTWSDFGDARGFHIYDTETDRLEFIQNPYTMFSKIMYNDKDQTLESIDAWNYNDYKNKYVKVIVESKTDGVLFDRFIGNLYAAEPIDIGVVEDFTEYNTIADLLEADGVDQSESTTTLLEKYIDKIEVTLDKEKLKNTMREIHKQAVEEELD